MLDLILRKYPLKHGETNILNNNQKIVFSKCHVGIFFFFEY